MAKSTAKAIAGGRTVPMTSHHRITIVYRANNNRPQSWEFSHFDNYRNFGLDRVVTVQRVALIMQCDLALRL